MTDEPAVEGRHMLVKHLTRHVGATITSVGFRLDPTTLQPTPTQSLALNDLGRLSLRLDEAVVADTAGHNRSTGYLILIDEVSNATAAAATIVAIT